jgi:Uma2 family endonuclease
MSAVPMPFLTPQEYLAHERRAETKSEYLRGEIFAMAGASREHMVEVLSPSTADYDRGGKFAHYRRLASLQEYVLISQDRPLVEHYVRQDSDQWLLSVSS